jgi:choline dehydrogenase
LFDYIVAGAGTAGCTLASRLTEDPGARVLLIEAGPADRRRDIHIPSAFPKLLGSALDWKDTTEPQTRLNARRLPWPRGKVLGGSGSIDALIHVRGCRADYDAWRDSGNPGWGFDDLQPLFAAGFSESGSTSTLSDVFLKACEACKLSNYTEEFRGPAEAGAGRFPLARKKNARWSSVDAFLRPALGRGNLTVWTGIQVARVIVEAGRAVGVEYIQRGSRFQVRAAREVILCAGAVASPQLLLLSGIGPKQQLEALGVPVAADLPGVGENLQDHLAAALSYSCTQPVSLAGSATRMNTLQYLARKRGPLSSNLIEAGAFAKSRPDLEACDLEVLFAPLGSLERGLDPPAEHGFSLFAASLTPTSRGRITLASADPLTPPRIDPEYLSAEEDRDLFRAALALARKIAESEPFSSYRGPASAFGMEDSARSMHHAAGACKMGLDATSVVDSSLQVHGVAALRVADASIMPVIPRAHPNATVVVIAEKAARLIREI